MNRGLRSICAGAASTRVGNELGRGKPKRAQLAAVTVIGLEVIFMLLVVVVGIAARDLWGYLFTSDPEVRLPQMCRTSIEGFSIYSNEIWIMLLMQGHAAGCMLSAPRRLASLIDCACSFRCLCRQCTAQLSM